MRLPNSLHWRITLVYTVLAFISLSLVSLLLINLLPDTNLIILITSIVTLVLLLSGSSVYILSYRASHSIRSVAEGARRLAAGDLECRASAIAGGEMAELTSAFNAMVLVLQGRIHDLSGDRDKLLAVLVTMADAVVVIGPGGTISLLNPAAETLLDVKSASAAGRHFVEVFRDPDLHRLISSCFETGQQQHAELELLHYRRYLSAVATALGEHGSVGVLLTLHDLTRMRQVETTRREFVSNVSHELRNPLGSVKAMIETLEDGALEDRRVARDFLKRIHKDVDRMVNLVNDLLELSRLESGGVTLHLASTDLRPLLEEALVQFQRPAREKGVVLEAKFPEELPPVLGEPRRLHQVLTNLLDNALKFTPAPGKVTLSASAEEHFIRVRVSDTGIGIASEHLPHIFERFYKVGRSGHDGGTGLGLAIVKHIIQAHKGEVDVQSQEGVGSAFSFTVLRASPPNNEL